MVGTGRGAQLGILLKGPEVLESTRAVDTVALDKTGTVTTGEMTVHDVIAADGVDADDMLARAAAVEANSEHPIGRAVVDRATVRGLDLPNTADFRNLAGAGVTAVIDGLRVASHSAPCGPQIVRVRSDDSGNSQSKQALGSSAPRLRSTTKTP